jgi:hypothetical protein
MPVDALGHVSDYPASARRGQRVFRLVVDMLATRHELASLDCELVDDPSPPGPTRHACISPLNGS